MKPPPRMRVRADRAVGLELLSKDSVRRWQQPEKRKLLRGLRRLGKGGHVDLDLGFLHTCVVTRSLPEIRSMVEALKNKVISGALVELRKWRSERNLRKPIEIWADLASSVSGDLEEPVSAAFAQMLMVSSTEPIALPGCDAPPHHRPVPLRLVPIAPVQALPSPTGTWKGPVRPLAAEESHRALLEAMAMNQSAAVQPPPDRCQTGAAPSASSQPSSPSLDVAPPPTASATSVPGVPPSAAACKRLSSSPAAVHRRTSKPAAKNSPRTPEVNYMVDFEKIYRYLSAVHKPDTKCDLTPMESAIMVDLLMSLPEEFQHLDCTKLHKHLLQAYKCLTLPTRCRDANETLGKLRSTFAGDGAGTPQNGNEGGVAAGGGEKLQPNESSLNQNTPNQPSSTDVTDFSPPPLNPFMIPSSMLMRK